jgi:methionyl-tRNA synthetase
MPDGPVGATPPPSPISLAEFSKVELCTAEVIEAHPHPKADRLMVMTIKLGERTKQIVAALRPAYAPEQLPGRIIIVVDNLEPATLRGERSEGMLLAVRLPDGGLSLLTTDRPAVSGLEVS